MQEEEERARAGEDMDTRGDQQRDGAEVSLRAATQPISHQSQHCLHRPTPPPVVARRRPHRRPGSGHHPGSVRTARDVVARRCSQHAFDAS